MATAKVPVLDPETGRLPEAYAPASIAQAVTAADEAKDLAVAAAESAGRAMTDAKQAKTDAEAAKNTLLDAASASATGDSLAQRTPSGTLVVAPAVESGEAVTLGQGDALYVAAPGIVPPARPQAAAWFSTRYTDVHVDPSPGSRYPLFAGQESSAWYANGKWNMIYSDGNIQYRSCNGDPTVAANWSAATQLVAGAGHGNLYEEAGTLYYYYVLFSDKTVRCITAPSTAPQGAWTAPVLVCTPTKPAAATTFDVGNMCLVKDTDGTYRLFQEVLSYEAMGSESAVHTWQTWVSTASTNLLSFADPVTTGTKLTTLRPYAASAVGGPEVFREGDQWVCYYHASVSGRSWPWQGYRAINTGSLGTNTWKVLDNNEPFLRRATIYDVDQAADPDPARDDAGVGYIFYAAGRNYDVAHFHIIAARLLPTLMVRTSQGSWVPAQSRDNGALPWINPYTPMVQSSTPYLDPTGQARVGTWALDSTPAGMQGGWRRTNTAPAINDSISFDVALAPGTYSLRWLHTTGPDHADVYVELAIHTLASFRQIQSFACYAAAETVNVASTATFTVSGDEAGRARLRLKAFQKNGSSSGYKVGDQGWLLTRTDI